MNCLHTLALLEDFADGTLSASEAVSVRVHLRDCPDCRAERDRTERLKQLLRTIRTPDPGADYWADNSALIQARTSDAADRREQTPEPDWRSPTVRREFYRSLVSVAVSLFILFAALLVGSRMDSQITRVGDDEQILVAAPNVGQFFAAGGNIMTRDLTIKLARGRMLLGPPGMLGKVPLSTHPAETDLINR